ncbi:MAG: response regulator [Vicinamibacterales bacterium]
MDDDACVEIVVVEDNPRDAELTVRALRKHGAAGALRVVRDGTEALDFLFARGPFSGRRATPPPKVILLDLKMPRMGGLELLEALKPDERTRSIPVVVISSSRQDSDIRSAYALGVSSYVVKPVDFDEFDDTLGRVGTYWMRVNQPPG